MSVAPGTRLGPYEVVAPIGAGGMGVVYKATDTRLGRCVAIKIASEQFSERFDREARAVAALNHPHICTLHDVGPDYLVMELLEGTPIHGPLPLDLAVKYAIQICDALDAAHRKGITHRDLKPANILITASGVKLLDFGLALMTQPGQVAVDDATACATSAGAILGTPGYMSPEQASGAPVDPRSDVFSFGAVLYEVLSGQRAFRGESIAGTLAAILRDDPPPVEAPPAMSAIVSRCLRKSPAERFQSAADVRAALERMSAGGPSSSPVVTEPGREPSIAVLPFVNTGGDKENEYFSDGLTEEIINTLAQVPGLKVIARTSAFAFRGKEQDIRTIAGSLGVRTVLEGSVRRSGQRVRVTARLVNAEDGANLWSARYDQHMEDIFAIQDEIATALASALEARLVVEPFGGARHTPRPGAYHALLRARFHLNRLTPESMGKARECLQEAMAIDPDYALPHSVLGGSFVTPAVYGIMPAHEAMPQARACYQRALAIDARLPEALVGLAAVAMLYDYDWTEAERLLGLAMSRGPLLGGARARYGHFLFFTGHPDLAVTQHEEAVLGDPLNVTLRSMLAWALMIAGRVPEAMDECRRILELNEHSHVGHFYASVAAWTQGDDATAIARAESALALAPWSLAIRGHTAGLLARAGDSARAATILGELDDRSAVGAPLGFVHYHLARADGEAAAEWVQQAIAQRDPMLLFVLSSPLGVAVRRSSRWPALAATMHLRETSTWFARSSS